MEIDIGALVFIISKLTYQKLFSEVPIHSAAFCLRTYTGEYLVVVGEVTTQVKYGSLGLVVVHYLDVTG